MAHPMGESNEGVLRLDFDRRLKLEFHGSKVMSDAGLLVYRELDDAVGLTEIAGNVLTDTRRGKNGRRRLVGQFRQSVFGRLGGYDDVNDADRLSLDPFRRAGDMVLQTTRQSGAVHQGRRERHQVDRIVVPQVPRQRRSAPASRPGLQSGHLHVDAGLAEGGGTLVADGATGLSGNGGQGRSRSAPKLSAMAGTSRSSWPRLPCRRNCSGKSSA